MKRRRRKRAKKKTSAKLRYGWRINPKTRVKPSAKIYKRSRRRNNED